MVVADVAGIPVAGAEGAAEELARLADEGGWAMATACGVLCVEGNCGAAERATSEVSSGVASFFHHAKLGPDLQPAETANIPAIIISGMAVRIIGLLPRLATRAML